MGELVANGVRLHYDEMGEGEETIVFSHSYLVSREHFEPQMEQLSSRYRCVAFDHRGHGRSEVPRDGYDMESLYADAEALVEALGCAPCHWVGLSTGGFVGMRLAVRRPELLRSLVLMDTSADAEPPSALRTYGVMLAVVQTLGYWPVVDRVVKMLFSPSTWKDPAKAGEVARWRRVMLANDRGAMVRFGRGIFGRESVLDQLESIRVPTLVIVGRDDLPTPVFRSQRIAERIAGARLEVIPDAGHLCTVERPDVVNQAIERFLAGLSD